MSDYLAMITIAAESPVENQRGQINLILNKKICEKLILLFLVIAIPCYIIN
jgi:hypothetical protein